MSLESWESKTYHGGPEKEEVNSTSRKMWKIRMTDQIRRRLWHRQAFGGNHWHIKLKSNNFFLYETTYRINKPEIILFLIGFAFRLILPPRRRRRRLLLLLSQVWQLDDGEERLRRETEDFPGI